VLITPKPCRHNAGVNHDLIGFESACPDCGYNVCVQIARGIRRCPECGRALPDISWHANPLWYGCC
jgi:ribosomal protein L37AE/L43A